MLFKRHKIRVGELDLIRTRLNKGEDACDLCCYSGRCTIMDLCTSIFTPTSPNENYDYYAIQKKGNNKNN